MPALKGGRSIGVLLIATIMLIAIELLGAAPSVQAAPQADRPAAARSGFRLAATSALTLDVPILMYHHIGARFSSPYNIATQDFAAQMNYLAQHGYTAVSVDQVAAALRGQTTLPPCPVAITFDDGYAVQVHNALPILQRHHFHATFYLVTGYISMSHAFMNWDQIKGLMKQGHWIGSHTYRHTAVGSLSGSALKREIVAAKTKLENGLGISVTTFSYPYGSYSLTAQRVISDAGFTSAVCSVMQEEPRAIIWRLSIY